MNALPMLTSIIQAAEDRWLDRLYWHIKDSYKQARLPSHDQDHHLRVWNISKQILRVLVDRCPMDAERIEGVLIAAMFHDLGMVKSHREDHGQLGAEMCRDWFRESGTETPPNLDEILEAIEKHDQKEEGAYPDLLPGQAPAIWSVVSIADDLEAMGAIGVYRYLEIYLRRGIAPDELGSRVLHNAGQRYRKLELACQSFPEVLDPYREQYQYLTTFFERFRDEIKLARNEESIRKEMP